MGSLINIFVLRPYGFSYISDPTLRNYLANLVGFFFLWQELLDNMRKLRYNRQTDARNIGGGSIDGIIEGGINH